MAHVQRAGGVGRDELDHHLRPLAAGGRSSRAAASTSATTACRARSLQTQVDEAGAGDLQRRSTQRCTAGSACSSSTRPAPLARVLLQAARQPHRGGDGQVAMRGLLGRLEGRGRAASGASCARAAAQRLQQLLLGLDHGRILRVGSARPPGHRHPAAPAPFKALLLAFRGRVGHHRDTPGRRLGVPAHAPPPPSRPHPTRRTAAQIGKYRVLARLGEGATSEVFLARDEFRGIDVAIKRVRLGLMADRENRTSSAASSPPRRRWSAG
jgi:hypothetical protein